MTEFDRRVCFNCKFFIYNVEKQLNPSEITLTNIIEIVLQGCGVGIDKFPMIEQKSEFYRVAGVRVGTIGL